MACNRSCDILVNPVSVRMISYKSDSVFVHLLIYGLKSCSCENSLQLQIEEIKGAIAGGDIVYGKRLLI